MARRVTKAEQVAAAAAASAARAAMSAQNDEVEIETNQDEADQDALRSLAALGEGGEVTFRLHCISPPGNRGSLDDVDRDDVPNLTQILKERYGPGKYVLSTLDSSGHYVRGGRRTITISSLAGPPRRPDAAPQAYPAGPSALSLAEFQARQDRADEQRRQERREDRKDLLQLAAIVLPALLGRGQQQGSTLADLTTALKNMKELGGDSTGLETLIRGIELGKDMGGGGDSIVGVIKEVVGSPATKSLLDNIAARGRAPAGPSPGPAGVPYRPAIPAPQRPPGAPPASTSSSSLPAPAGVPEPMWLNAILPVLNRLAQELYEFAQNGADPGLAAEALVAKIPRNLRALVKVEQLTGWLQNPNWWTVLKGFKPELEPYQGYCDDVRTMLVKLLTEPETEPESP